MEELYTGGGRGGGKKKKNKVYKMLTLITFMEKLNRNPDPIFMLWGAISFYIIANPENLLRGVTKKKLIFFIFPLFFLLFLVIFLKFFSFFKKEK